MTKEQKAAVLKKRDEIIAKDAARIKAFLEAGYSYKDIAQKTGLAESVVRHLSTK